MLQKSPPFQVEMTEFFFLLKFYLCSAPKEPPIPQEHTPSLCATPLKEGN